MVILSVLNIKTPHQLELPSFINPPFSMIIIINIRLSVSLWAWL